MSLICLDAEFANGSRMLELAIHALDDAPLFHEYFKPVGMRYWRSDIHHITPKMVAGKKPFGAYLSRIQRIVDGAERVIGFAVNNDFEKMSREGITGLEVKKVVELRDWFWMCIGQYEDVPYGSGPGLAAVAERLGIAFDEGAEHTASGDTLMTLECFRRLYAIYSEKFLTPEQQQLPVEEGVELFDAIYDREREPVMREMAHGYCTVLLTPKGHKLRFGHSQPSRCHAEEGESQNTEILTIEVADRYKAEVEIRKKLSKRQSRNLIGVYGLRPADLDAIRRYSNTYVMADSEYYHSLVRSRGKAISLL